MSQNPVKAVSKRSGRGGPQSSAGSNELHLNHAQQAIGPWLSKLRFRRQLIGGVSEADVWKKIAELNDMYEAALCAERARYEALLEQARKENAGG